MGFGFGWVRNGFAFAIFIRTGVDSRRLLGFASSYILRGAGGPPRTGLAEPSLPQASARALHLASPLELRGRARPAGRPRCSLDLASAPWLLLIFYAPTSSSMAPANGTVEKNEKIGTVYFAPCFQRVRRQIDRGNGGKGEMCEKGIHLAKTAKQPGVWNTSCQPARVCVKTRGAGSVCSGGLPSARPGRVGRQFRYSALRGPRPSLRSRSSKRESARSGSSLGSPLAHMVGNKERCP